MVQFEFAVRPLGKLPESNAQVTLPTPLVGVSVQV